MPAAVYFPSTREHIGKAAHGHTSNAKRATVASGSGKSIRMVHGRVCVVRMKVGRWRNKVVSELRAKVRVGIHNTVTRARQTTQKLNSRPAQDRLLKQPCWRTTRGCGPGVHLLHSRQSFAKCAHERREATSFRMTESLWHS